MRGTVAQGDLRGKTGTLTDASNLSGYVKSANGEWLVFSLLMNKDDIDVGEAHAAQDAIGAALAISRPPGKIVWSPSPTS
jgi:serine-type D-Ala-D-Ala carboxypeptidase/endopeptidase (penicillin-binding protein 4)